MQASHPNKIKKLQTRFYIIDIIRGLAALSVLLSHWGGWTERYADEFTKKIILILQAPINFIWQGGGTHPGVVIFIVLSGFCIHLSVEKNTHQIKDKNFWKVYYLRRAIRIYPVYWFALTVGLLVTFLISSNTALSSNLIVSFLISFIGIAELVRQTGLFHYLYLGNPPLGTVGVEILLYASYRFFRHLYKFGGRKLLCIFSCACYLIFILMRYFGMPLEMSLGSYFEFVPYWIWGAICAEIYSVHFKDKIVKRRYILCAVLTSGSYILLITQIEMRGLYLVTSPLLAATAGLLLAILLDREVRGKQDFSKVPLLSAIGERGYSLYAIHTPIIFFVLWFLDKQEFNSWAYPIVTLSCVFIATEFCYRIIERPAHRIAQNISNSNRDTESIKG